MGHSGCGPIMYPTQHMATFITTDKEILIRALTAAENAREWAAELLAVHDSNLGRTTVKNKMWALHLERSIAESKRSIAECVWYWVTNEPSNFQERI